MEQDSWKRQRIAVVTFKTHIQSRKYKSVRNKKGFIFPPSATLEFA